MEDIQSDATPGIIHTIIGDGRDPSDETRTGCKRARAGGQSGTRQIGAFTPETPDRLTKILSARVMGEVVCRAAAALPGG